MTDVTQADREAAASVAVLLEMRELIRAGKADYHAEPFARHREVERAAIEERFWSIVDADGLCGAPSDMWAALEYLARAARNRDMWKGQCERQAASLTAMRAALHDAIDRPKGVVPASAEEFYLKPAIERGDHR